MRNQTQACARLMSTAEIGRLAAPFAALARAGDPAPPGGLSEPVGALDHIQGMLLRSHRAVDSLALRLSRVTELAEPSGGHQLQPAPPDPHIVDIGESSVALAIRLESLLSRIVL
jgi:hypothetical protein